MNQDKLSQIIEQLKKERRTLAHSIAENDGRFEEITDSRETELEEHAQEERDTRVLERLDERQQSRMRDIDEALSRIERGDYEVCTNCGGPIDEKRLLINHTTTLCVACAGNAEDSPGESADDEVPTAAELPPDLDGLDDAELSEYLMTLVQEDGQVDTEELILKARNGVIFLDGAVPSEGEHQVLLNVLTDVAGVREIVDHLEVVRLAWEREDRSQAEAAQDVMPGTVPAQEPEGGTEDVVLSNEEGIPYEPPIHPPPPPHRED